MPITTMGGKEREEDGEEDRYHVVDEFEFEAFPRGI